MPQVEQVPLPGVGVRHCFTTRGGQVVGVVHSPSGSIELHLGTTCEADATLLRIPLSDDEVHTLVEMLGGLQVTTSLARLRQYVEGLAIEWINVGAASPVVGKSIAEAGIRARSGASIVAVVRGEVTNPAPQPRFSIEGGDTLVVVGTADGISRATSVIRGDPDPTVPEAGPTPTGG